jgi:hypothetical protein
MAPRRLIGGNDVGHAVLLREWERHVVFETMISNDPGMIRSLLSWRLGCTSNRGHMKQEPLHSLRLCENYGPEGS